MIDRGFLVLVVWLLIAPVVGNIVEAPGRNPFFPSGPSEDEVQTSAPQPRNAPVHGYFVNPETVTVKEALEPTRIFFAAFFLIFLGRYFLRDKRILSLDRTEKWMAIFALLLIANVILLSSRFFFSARIAIDAFIVPFLAYFTARRFVTNEERFRQLTRFMAYLGVYVIVSGLLERVLNTTLEHRIQGPFRTRDYLFVAMTVIFFMLTTDAVLQWFRKRRISGLPRALLYFVVVMCPVIILLTLTRGNWVGFMAGLWVFAFLSRKLLTQRQKLATVGLAIGLVPIVLIGALELSQTSLLRDRVNNVNTIAIRFTTYATVIREGINNPILGIGLNNLRDVLRRKAPNIDEKTLGTAHNSYLAIFSELGVFALLTYLAMMGAICKTGLRIFRAEKDLADRWRGVAAVAMVTAYMVAGLFTHYVYSQLLAHIYLYACVGAIAGRYGLRQPHAVNLSHPIRIKKPVYSELISDR
jgi:O-Antigen ligase